MNGLDNGIKASIPQLEIDILKSTDFLGVHHNAAIFVNKSTYKLLGSHHKNWVVNRTIALKDDFLRQDPIDVIGAIIHETGHAFNVAAKISNNETNAYIYEIEVMCKLLEMKSPLLFRCEFKDIQSYFNRRLTYYKKGTTDNEYLACLVKSISDQFELEESPAVFPQKTTKNLNFFNNEMSLFSKKQWSKENTLILSKTALGL